MPGHLRRVLRLLLLAQRLAERGLLQGAEPLPLVGRPPAQPELARAPQELAPQALERRGLVVRLVADRLRRESWAERRRRLGERGRRELRVVRARPDLLGRADLPVQMGQLDLQGAQDRLVLLARMGPQVRMGPRLRVGRLRVRR